PRDRSGRASRRRAAAARPWRAARPGSRAGLAWASRRAPPRSVRPGNGGRGAAPFSRVAWSVSSASLLPSVDLLDELERVVRLLVSAALLPVRQLDLLALPLLLRDLLEQMRDEIEPGAPLVVAAHHVAGGERRIGSCEHGVARGGVVVPATVGLEVHR